MPRKTDVTTQIKPGDNPPPLDILADAIVQVAEASRKMQASPFKHDMLCQLIRLSMPSSKRAGITIQQISDVLTYSADLEKAWFK